MKTRALLLTIILIGTLALLFTHAKPAEAKVYPITITSPAANSVIAKRFVLAGTTTVFEGTVDYEVYRYINGNKRVVLRGYTTATCGSGCRGTYRKRLTMPARANRGGYYVSVFSVSQEDGSRQHERRVRVFYRGT